MVTSVAGPRPRRARPFVRPLRLPGWAGSTWGYDAGLECFWAELRPDPEAGGDGAVRIAPDHLIPTVAGLAAAVARTARVPRDEAYAALTS
jgi:hypothetical protein